MKTAYKAQSLSKKSTSKTASVEALAGDGQEEAEHDREQQPDERSESGSAAATPSSPSPQQDEDETHHTESDNEQEIGEKTVKLLEHKFHRLDFHKLADFRRVNLPIHQGWLWPRQPNRKF